MSQEEANQAQKSANKMGFMIFAATFIVSALVIAITIYRTPKFTYHYVQPELKEGYFLQVTWQSKPVEELSHIVCFLKKPEVYNTTTMNSLGTTFHEGYSIQPRVFHYNGIELKSSVEKEHRLRGKVKIWLMHNGCAVPILGAKPELIAQWKERDKLADTELYKTYILPKLKEIEAQLASGELEISPQRMRSDFMQMR